MREATILGMGLAMVLALLAASQLTPAFSSVQAVTSGALSLLMGNLPLILVLTAVLIVVAFAVTLARHQ